MVPRAVGAQRTSGGGGGDASAALVPRHAVGHGSGCQGILLPAAASCSSPAAPWREGAEPHQGWRPQGCHLPRAPALNFTWGLLAGGMCCSTSCSGAFGDMVSLPWLSPSPNCPLPERKPWGDRCGRVGRGWQAPRPPPAMRDVSEAPLLPVSRQLEETPPAPRWEGTLHPVKGAGTLSSPQPHSRLLTHLSAAVQLPCAEGCPAGQARVHASTTASLTPGRTDRQKLSLPTLVSTFSQAPAPASSSWPPLVGFYT